VIAGPPMLGINLDKLIAVALETIDTLGSGAPGYRQRTGNNSPSHRQSAQIGPKRRSGKYPLRLDRRPLGKRPDGCSLNIAPVSPVHVNWTENSEPPNCRPAVTRPNFKQAHYPPSNVLAVECPVSLERKHPHGSAIRHGRNLAGKQASQHVHFSAGVLAPASQHGNVLLPVDGERSRRRLDP
jgi:hypothetical protein